MSAQPSLTGNHMVMSNPFESVKQNATRGNAKGGVKMSVSGSEILRWNSDEWRIAVAGALPHLNAGMTVVDALMKGQKALPKVRQRTLEQMNSTALRSARQEHGPVETWIAQMRESLRMPAPIVVRPTAPKQRTSIDDDVMNGDAPRWSPKEWARIAREVKRMQDDGDDRNLGRMMIEAQEVVLAPRRWRMESGLMQGNAKETDGGTKNQRQLAEGWKNICLLEDDTPPPAAPAPEAQPETVIEMVTHTPQPETAQEAPKPQLAPTPLQLPLSTFAGSMQAFADTFQHALDVLLKDHEAHIISTMDSRLHTAADQIASAVSAQISEGLRRTVLATMAQELGGPVNPGPAAPSASPAPSTPPAPSAPPSVSPLDAAPPIKHYSMWGPGEIAAAQAAAVPVVYKGQPRIEPAPTEYAPDEPESEGKVKVDVVGLKGSNASEVRNAFNGHTSLRFIDPDEVKGWVPRRDCHVVLATKFIPHMASWKCARYHVKPVYAKGGGASVIQAIKKIHEQEGVAQ